MLLQRCWKQQCRFLQQPTRILSRTTRFYSSTNHGINISSPVQSYISRSSDPYLNLSIEHYLLQKSPPDSKILFLYINRPSVIIGRNQNPWLEVNLQLLSAGGRDKAQGRLQTEPRGLGQVDLVRRRSGGGTVFHDEGNVNWSVICNPSIFTRDKHAEMVVRGLRRLGVGRARVNERHDIVLDQGVSEVDDWGAERDTHSTPWISRDIRPLKVSGSAYKVTRNRALHHGTALLGSANLDVIPGYLRARAKRWIKGRGVDSVSSPVGNIGVGNERFVGEVQREFGGMYGEEEVVEVGEECLGIEEVEKGYKELKSLEWTFLQTPQFTFSDVPVEHPDADVDYSDAKFRLDVRYGAITGCKLQTGDVTVQQSERLTELVEKKQLHEVKDWSTLFKDAGIESKEALETAKWTQDMLSVPSE